MSDAYKKVVLGGGRLKIAGKEVELKKKKKKRKRTEEGGEGKASKGGVEGAEKEELQAKIGSGRITSSGQIVTGYDTKFLNELKVNDAIIITHPTTLTEETRIIKVIVSNTGMSISSGFSSDLISTTSFKYIHPPSDEKAEDAEEIKRRKALEEENSAFGTYASSGGTKSVYRVKKSGVYGGYKIITEDLNNQLSRTELMELRAKHKADRHAS